MIYAFKVTDENVIKDIRKGKVDDLFLEPRLDIVGGFTGINSFEQCKKDKDCFEWIKTYPADLFAYENNKGDWIVQLRQHVAKWK